MVHVINYGKNVRDDYAITRSNSSSSNSDILVNIKDDSDLG